MRTHNLHLPEYLRADVNLASPRLGAQIVEVTDEFFGAAPRMLQDTQPIFHPDRYDEHGKWMDGWETRRRRDAGHDWALIRLGVPGDIRGVEIDTAHFTGNFPRAASLEAWVGEGATQEAPPGPDADWATVLEAKDLSPDNRHVWPAEAVGPVRWVRLRIFPDGGIARLKLYGAPFRAWTRANPLEEHELSALKNGGRVISFSDAHYGDLWALLSDGRGLNMGDGWETRRRREPGNDWIIIRLGHPGMVTRIEIDTAFFKGNYPYRASVEAALVDEGTDESVVTQSLYWPELLSPAPMEADAIHTFTAEKFRDLGPVSHVKLNIFPDGGVSRFRVFGVLARSQRSAAMDAPVVRV